MPRADALRVHRPGAGANPLRAGRELLLSFAFRCNFACTFCYVEDGLGGRFRGVDLDEARRLLADPRLTDGVTRIVLSGGEVTLDKDLPRYVALARAVPSVEHVRIQTNASRLGDGALADRLIAAGVDEFFVSLHGADEATCDAITREPGSFAAILAGLDALRARGATVVTNTVICAANVGQLAAVIALAADRGAAGAELWGYVPRVDAADARAQLVRVTEAAPHVQRALAAAEARALPTCVKYFPRCLLGRFAHVHSDAQPRLVIDDAFWQDYPQYGCLYEGVCRAAVDDGCSGLPDAYVRRFGWEEDALAPEGDRAAPAEAPPIAAYHSWAHAPASDAPAAATARDDSADDVADDVLAALGLTAGAQLAGYRIGPARRGTGSVRLRFADERDAIEIDLWPRDPDRAGFARTASLDLTHPLLADDATARARPLFAAIAAHLAARDRGDLARVLAAPPAASRARAAAPLLPGWPGVDHPAARALLAVAAELVAADRLAPGEIEPSVALGRAGELRVIVNPSVPGPGRDRPAIAAALLDALDAPGWMRDLATGWLAVPHRVAFVGLAAETDAPRAKLYLQTRAAGDRAAAAAALGLALADEVLVGVDAIAGRRAAVKRYAPIAAAAARARFAGPLLALLEARGLLLGELPLLVAHRVDGDGAPVDASLHVGVGAFPQLALGVAWARASGDARAAALLAAANRSTRVLADGDRRVVYLGGAP